MRKLISKTRGKCPKCGKKGLIKIYDAGMDYCEHSRNKTDIIILGQPVWNSEGCLLPKQK